jgi:anthranilate phosphoribosyltransferase
LANDKIKSYEISPEQFGIQKQSLEVIKVENADDSLAMINEVFAGKSGPAFDIVCLNAGAALYAADLVDSISAGVAKSRDLLMSGKVAQKFDSFLKF